LQQNERLVAEVAGELARAEVKSRQTDKSARSFKDFMYRTRRSWSCRRRVIGKAEFTEDEVLAVCPPHHGRDQKQYANQYAGSITWIGRYGSAATV
jgi:hypothetical protein